MDRKTSEYLIALLIHTEKDLRIWINGKIYHRIDGNKERLFNFYESESDMILHIEYQDERENYHVVDVPMSQVNKVTIAKNINIGYYTDDIKI